MDKKRSRPPQPLPDLDTLPGSAVLDTATMSRITGFAVVTFKVWRTRGRGPKVTLIEGRPRYLARDVRAWLGNTEAA